MRRKDIQVGAEVYYAAGDPWRSVPPTKAVIADGQPYRIVRQRCGAFYLVSHHPDPAGTAVLVDLHEGAKVRRTAVPARHLRGLWKETLAATGRTVAGVKAHGAFIAELAAKPGEITGADILPVAAHDEAVDHGALAVLADAAETEGAR